MFFATDIGDELQIPYPGMKERNYLSRAIFETALYPETSSSEIFGLFFLHD